MAGSVSSLPPAMSALPPSLPATWTVAAGAMPIGIALVDWIVAGIGVAVGADGGGEDARIVLGLPLAPLGFICVPMACPQPNTLDNDRGHQN